MFKYEPRLFAAMAKEKYLTKQKLMVYFIAFVMISSTFAVIFFGYRQPDSQTKLTYNDYKFLRTNIGWQTKINKQNIIFTYNPKQAESLNISKEVVARLKNTPQIDLTSAINDSFADTIAVVQFDMNNILSLANIYVRGGFIDYQTEAIPIINCTAATSFVPVLYMKEGNETKLYLDGNCIIAQADKQDTFFLMRDRILYSILGIMD